MSRQISQSFLSQIQAGSKAPFKNNVPEILSSVKSCVGAFLEETSKFVAIIQSAYGISKKKKKDKQTNKQTNKQTKQKNLQGPGLEIKKMVSCAKNRFQIIICGLGVTFP